MLLLGAAIVVLVFAAFVDQFGALTGSGGSDERARFGEFIGGVTGPVLSYLTIVGLILTLLIQIDLLQDTREQLADAERKEGRTTESTEEAAYALLELTRCAKSSAQLSTLAASLLVADRLEDTDAGHVLGGGQHVALLKELLELARELAAQHGTVNPQARRGGVETG